jgi:hypothetical protein
MSAFASASRMYTSNSRSCRATCKALSRAVRALGRLVIEFQLQTQPLLSASCFPSLPYIRLYHGGTP